MDEELRKRYIRIGAMPVITFLVIRMVFKSFFMEHFTLEMILLGILAANLLVMMYKAHQIRKYPKERFILAGVFILIGVVLVLYRFVTY